MINHAIPKIENKKRNYSISVEFNVIMALNSEGRVSFGNGK